MSTAVYTKSFDAPPTDIREIMRYAGCRTDDAATEALIRECLDAALPALIYKACFCELDVSIEGSEVQLGEIKASSASLARRLAGCERAVVFAATVGIGLDRLIARYSRISPARALCLQAIGAERVESICDVFENGVREKCREARVRFSPGYGDLSLELQRELVDLLDCNRRMGLTLNQNLTLSPTKSVTAIIGVKK